MLPSSVEQQAVALLAHGQVDHVHRHQGFKRGGGIAHLMSLELAHVRHVEQAGGGAGVHVLGHQAGGVLHGHVVAPERHRLGTEFDVQGVQRCGEQGSGWRGRCGRGCGHGMTPGQMGAATRWVTEFALLSALPERFTAAPWLAVRFAPSVDGFITHCASHLSPARERPHHCGRLSVLLPERSAAACAFGGAALPSSKVGHSLLTAAIVSLLCVDEVAQSQR